jgi:hypothetical protein
MNRVGLLGISVGRIENRQKIIGRKPLPKRADLEEVSADYLPIIFFWRSVAIEKKIIGKKYP